MGMHMIDSEFFKDFYGSREMRDVFSSDSLLQKWLDSEAALARAQAKLNVIPTEAAKEIALKADAALFDKDRIRQLMMETVHPIVPVIREFEKLCENDYGQYLHWGATTQDIMDTANALQMKEAHRIIVERLFALERVLIGLADKHKNTVMPGRTHGQHALPITLGYKVSVWICEFQRHLQRLFECRERLLVGQFFGAAGTLASVKDKGFEILKLMMEDLGLRIPSGPWHVARDRFAEFVSILGMISGTVGKIANEIISLQKTEILELEEPFVMGKVGSSTMPHKRNPMKCENIVALSKIARANVPLVQDAMVQEHERDMGPWQVEWEAIPEACVITAAAVEQMTEVMSGLIVYPDRMQRNLEATQGLILSEAVMLHLAKTMGRQRAHDLIYEVSMEAFDEGINLGEALRSRPEITGLMSHDEIEAVLDPKNYIGLSRELTEIAIAEYEKFQSLWAGKERV